jgi:hypothetical protein
MREWERAQMESLTKLWEEWPLIKEINKTKIFTEVDLWLQGVKVFIWPILGHLKDLFNFFKCKDYNKTYLFYVKRHLFVEKSLDLTITVTCIFIYRLKQNKNMRILGFAQR